MGHKRHREAEERTQPDRDREHRRPDRTEDDDRAMDLDRARAEFDLDEDLDDELAEMDDEDPLAGGDRLDEDEVEAETGSTSEDFRKAAEEGLSYEPRDTPMCDEATRYGDQELIPGISGNTPSRFEHLDVEEDVESRQGARPDEDLLDDVQRALLETPSTTALGLEVEVHDGVVTLRGEVQTEDDADLAALIASRVRGVREVDDETIVPGMA